MVRYLKTLGAIWFMAALAAGAAQAQSVTGTFASIDGGTLSVEDWRGQPVLVINTASQCGFTPQLRNMQRLHEAYAGQGVVVLAIPSDDFNQELETGAAVKDFCEVQFGLTLPMADITSVVGASAHPFFQQVRAQTGFEPNWNFNKILIAPDGTIAGTWRSRVRPDAQIITRKIEAYLAGG